LKGEKKILKAVARLKLKKQVQLINSFDELYARVMQNASFSRFNLVGLSPLEIEALEIEADLLSQTLALLIFLQSDSCFTLETQVPDAMSFEMPKLSKNQKGSWRRYG